MGQGAFPRPAAIGARRYRNLYMEGGIATHFLQPSHFLQAGSNPGYPPPSPPGGGPLSSTTRRHSSSTRPRSSQARTREPRASATCTQ